MRAALMPLEVEIVLTNWPGSPTPVEEPDRDDIPLTAHTSPPKALFTLGVDLADLNSDGTNPSEYFGASSGVNEDRAANSNNFSRMNRDDAMTSKNSGNTINTRGQTRAAPTSSSWPVTFIDANNERPYYAVSLGGSAITEAKVSNIESPGSPGATRDVVMANDAAAVIEFSSGASLNTAQSNRLRSVGFAVENAGEIDNVVATTSTSSSGRSAVTRHDLVMNSESASQFNQVEVFSTSIGGGYQLRWPVSANTVAHTMQLALAGTFQRQIETRPAPTSGPLSVQFGFEPKVVFVSTDGDSTALDAIQYDVFRQCTGVITAAAQFSASSTAYTGGNNYRRLDNSNILYCHDAVGGVFMAASGALSGDTLTLTFSQNPPKGVLLQFMALGDESGVQPPSDAQNVLYVLG